MKRGLIVYVTGGGELHEDSWGSYACMDRFAADVVGVAHSEFDIAENWWRMITRGMQEILCVRAQVDDEGMTFVGAPLRICG